MQIIYTPNPLTTKVILDEFEKKELWYKIKIEEMQEILTDCHFSLNDNKIQEAINSSNPEYYMVDEPQKSQLDQRCNELLQHFIHELQSSHIGDCTCLPCSCSKCIAENYLGIDTTKGLSKHSAHKIYSAFSSENNTIVSIDEALEKLKNPKFEKTSVWNNFSQQNFDSYIPKWTEDYKKAYEWLLDYKKNHSF